MSYFNRKELLFATLRSFLSTTTKSKDFEVVIVDDNSNEEHKLGQSMFTEFPFSVKLISISKEEKWWYCSSIPINMSVQAASGDVIIIQNPECIHVGDVITHAISCCEESDMLSYHCLAANDIETKEILKLDTLNEYNLLNCVQNSQSNNWYNHRQHRPKAYHFLSAMKRKAFMEMRGFDERYANGVAYDDDEFIHRVRLKNLNIIFVDYPFCIHLLHENFFYKIPNIKELEEINRSLYNGTTLAENKWIANESSKLWGSLNE